MSYYDQCVKIKCYKCGAIFSPFYFGDKPLDRGVMQECPACETTNSFSPRDVDNGPADTYIKGVPGRKSLGGRRPPRIKLKPTDKVVRKDNDLLRGITSGRFQCKKPNQSAKPRSKKK